MKELRRYLEAQVRADLDRKMVFVGGPWQVGKTTMARRILGRETRGYLNWDVAEHRQKILQGELPPTKLVVFDEIHKYRPWRNYLKGIYDEAPSARHVLVTGSARQDLYRRGADSLVCHAPDVANRSIRGRFDPFLTSLRDPRLDSLASLQRIESTVSSSGC